MTAGFQVPLEATFVKVFENNLNHGSSIGEWQAINASVNAFGTDNELVFYDLEGRNYQPEFVILGIYLANDIYNNSHVLDLRHGGSSHKPYFKLNQEGELQLFNFPVPENDSLSLRMGSFLKRHFQLPRFLAQVLRLRYGVPDLMSPFVHLFAAGRGGQLAQGDERHQGRSDDICDEEYSPVVEEAWEITRALIRELRTIVEASNANLAVLVIPAAPQLIPPRDGIGWYCQRPNDEIDAFLGAEGIPYLDLLGPFREHVLAGGESLYYERDLHLNEVGHRQAGDLLYEFFTSDLDWES